MAHASAKQLLDELMGRGRDLMPNEQNSTENWREARVCKHFLVKFCPNSLFTNTKADIGPCNLVHDDFIKKSYEERATHKEKTQFEDEFIRFCQQQLNDVERKIKRAKQRLEMSQAEKLAGDKMDTFMSEENQEKMNILTERIEKLLEQAEAAGCDGKVEEAQGIMKLVEKVKEEKSAIRRDSMPMNHWIQQKAEIGAAQEKQMEVCDVCGAFLIVNDVQQRVDDHLLGKQHQGFGKLKSALDEILESRRLESDRDRERERDRDRDKKGDRRVGSWKNERDDDRRERRDRRHHKHRRRSRSRSADRERKRPKSDGHRRESREKI